MGGKIGNILKNKKFGNLAKILKFGNNMEIWGKIWNFGEKIEDFEEKKFGNNVENLGINWKFGKKGEIWKKFGNFKT